MINRKLLYIFYFIVLIISCIACNRNKIISRDKMIAVLHDIQVAEAIQQNKHQEFKERDSKDALIEGVLEKHGITQTQLDSSLVWYSDNVEIFIRVNDSVIATLKRESDKANQQIQRMSYQRTVNFSILPEFTYLTQTNPTLTFEVDSTRMRRFPAFEIGFNTLWMQEGMEADFSVSFSYIDTVLTEYKKLTKDGFYKISKPDRKERLKYIYGYIHLAEDDENPERKMFLYNISIRDSIRVAKIDSTKINEKIKK